MDQESGLDIFRIKRIDNQIFWSFLQLNKLLMAQIFSRVFSISFKVFDFCSSESCSKKSEIRSKLQHKPFVRFLNNLYS